MSYEPEAGRCWTGQGGRVLVWVGSENLHVSENKPTKDLPYRWLVVRDEVQPYWERW